MQDENIRGWHKGLFGKQVQNSALGTLKRKLMANDKVLVIDRFFPSTRMCICGHMRGCAYAGICMRASRSPTGCSYAPHADILRIVM